MWAKALKTDSYFSHCAERCCGSGLAAAYSARSASEALPALNFLPMSLSAKPA